MSKDEIAELLIQIKTIYPRFEGAVREGDGFHANWSVADSWYRMIGYMTKDRAQKILKAHMQSDDGDKVPNLSLFLRNGSDQPPDVRCTMTLDRRNSCIVWKPDPKGETYEIPVRWNGWEWEDKEGRLYATP